jgi:hypothetical protein
MIDRDKFFKSAREIQGGALKQSQVDGYAAILDDYTRRQWSDVRWLAYMLATAHWETARTMQAIKEYGLGKGRPYGKPDAETGQTYYGRGLVQLTWKENYAKAGTKIGKDLVNHPDEALFLPNAVAIMATGMSEGWFAGDKAGRHNLPRYFSGSIEDPVGARRIINGTDKSQEIAQLYRSYMAAL